MPISKASSNAVAPGAKGDLVVGTTTNDSGILGVGSNGETLVADSSASVGLRYQEPKAGNPVINSSFQIWQRGTSLAGGTTGYHSDRWRFFTANTNSTASRQNTSDTTNLPNIQYCFRGQRNSGSSGLDYFYLNQPFETVNSIPFAGKTVTFSFYARAGSNYSQASNGLFAYLYSGTGTDQSWVSGFTNAATPCSGTATLTTTWQRFSYTGTVAATATQLAVVFESRPTGTAGANDYFEVTGVQVEVGSVATPFKTQGVTLAGELAACQRYYWRSYGSGSNANWGFGQVPASGYSITAMQNPVRMRVAATSIDTNNLFFYDPIPATNYTVDSITTVNNTDSTSILRFNKSTLTNVGRVGYLNGDATSYIGFSAEL